MIRERLEQYEAQTEPLIEFFRRAGVPADRSGCGEATPKQIAQARSDRLSRAIRLRRAASCGVAV